jgi:hypothetical protein
MLDIQLGKEGFTIWRDQGAIRAGDDWRRSIEDGIQGCLAVVVALSASSADSAYVTYEWAYAIGMSKPVIPVKLSDCRVHPRLEPTQYIDFSYPRALPWDALVQRLKDIDESEVEKGSTGRTAKAAAAITSSATELDKAAGQILEYLSSKGYTMVSFDRLRQKGVVPNLTKDVFEELIASRPAIFRPATIKGGKSGIAKMVP